MATDHPRETFDMIAKRVLPRGFGRLKSTAALKREAPKMFDLARSK
jgi:hypothetical protein